MSDWEKQRRLEYLAERALQATPELRIPARFDERARLDRLDWIAKASVGGRKALEHCRKFARDPLRVKAPLLTGKSGCGKTHLLLAVAREIHERMVVEIEGKRTAYEAEVSSWNDDKEVAFPVRRIRTTTGAEIVGEIRDTIQGRDLESVVARYRQLHKKRKDFSVTLETSPPPGSCLVLLVDDIEVCKLGEWVSEAFYRILDFRYAENLPTAIASNLAPEELLRHFGDRIARRIFDLTEPFEL